MNEALERRRKAVLAATEGEVELPSGGTAGLVLPNLKKLLLSGDIALPVLQRMQKVGANGDGEDLDLTMLRELSEYNDGLIRDAVKTLDGEPVVLTGVVLDEVFTAEDQADLIAYIQRTKPLPGKA
jgi:hypothetical protein